MLERFLKNNAACAAAAAAVLMGTGAMARADEPSAAELRTQVEAMQKQINRIEAREASAADQNAATAKVLDDAQRRSQLLQAGGVTAGWDGKKLFIGSADGKFMFKPGFQFQFRNITSWRQGEDPSGNDDFQNGFELRRMKFGMQGNLFSKDLTYNFLWGTSRSTGTPVLEEGWVKYKLSEDFAVRAGQFKDPLNRESLTSSTALLSTERSYQTDVFFGGDNFVQGASLIYDNGGPIKGEFAFTDGAISSNNNFQDPPTGLDQNYGVAARAEYLVFGDWKALNDFSAARVETDSLSIGLGVDYTEGEQANAGTKNTIRYTADALYKLASNWSFYGAVNGRYSDVSGGTSGNDWGALVQVAWSPDDKIEPFVRYGYTSFDTLAVGVEDTVHEITVGANYYFYGHNAKFTMDLTYLPNGAPVGDGGADILASDDNQVVLRGQFQLAL